MTQLIPFSNHAKSKCREKMEKKSFNRKTALPETANNSPVSNMINKVLLEHKAPALDDVEK